MGQNWSERRKKLPRRKVWKVIFPILRSLVRCAEGARFGKKSKSQLKLSRQKLDLFSSQKSQFPMRKIALRFQPNLTFIVIERPNIGFQMLHSFVGFMVWGEMISTSTAFRYQSCVRYDSDRSRLLSYSFPAKFQNSWLQMWIMAGDTWPAETRSSPKFFNGWFHTLFPVHVPPSSVPMFHYGSTVPLFHRFDAFPPLLLLSLFGLRTFPVYSFFGSTLLFRLAPSLLFALFWWRT